MTNRKQIVLGEHSGWLLKMLGTNNPIYSGALTLELEIGLLRKAIILTLEQNGHLADGDNCSLIELKKVIDYD